MKRATDRARSRPRLWRYAVAMLAGMAVSLLWGWYSHANAQATLTPQNSKWIPPVEYDRPYTGKLNISRVSAEQIVKLCPKSTAFPIPLACSWRFEDGVRCEVVIANDEILKENGGWTVAIVLRHELGHCNGWPSNHAGGQRTLKDATQRAER